MIKAVIFDIDGVLLDSREANIKFYESLIEKAGYPVPTKTQLEELMHLTMMDLLKVVLKRESPERIEKVWQMGAGREVPYPIELQKVPIGAKKTVRHLSKKYKLALVTGRAARGTGDFFEVFGHRNLFPVVSHAGEYKNPKPDPEPIIIALNKLGLAPAEAVYVGDSLVDFQAALASGTFFISYSARGIRVRGAEYHAESFSQIPTIVEKF